MSKNSDSRYLIKTILGYWGYMYLDGVGWIHNKGRLYACLKMPEQFTVTNVYLESEQYRILLNLSELPKTNYKVINDIDGVEFFSKEAKETYYEAY